MSAIARYLSLVYFTYVLAIVFVFVALEISTIATVTSQLTIPSSHHPSTNFFQIQNATSQLTTPSSHHPSANFFQIQNIDFVISFSLDKLVYYNGDIMGITLEGDFSQLDSSMALQVEVYDPDNPTWERISLLMFSFFFNSPPTTDPFLVNVPTPTNSSFSSTHLVVEIMVLDSGGTIVSSYISPLDLIHYYSVEWVSAGNCVEKGTLHQCSDTSSPSSGITEFAFVYCKVFSAHPTISSLYQLQATMCDAAGKPFQYIETCTFSPVCPLSTQKCMNNRCICNQNGKYGDDCSHDFGLDTLQLVQWSTDPPPFTSDPTSLDVGVRHELIFAPTDTTTSTLTYSYTIILLDGNKDIIQFDFPQSLISPSSSSFSDFSFKSIPLPSSIHYAYFLLNYSPIFDIGMENLDASLHFPSPIYPVYTHDWVVQLWQDCTGVCSNGVQVRSVECHRFQGSIDVGLTSNQFCRYLSEPRPLDVQNCDLPPPSDLIWCHNGGMCGATSDGIGFCICPTAFEGDRCETLTCSHCDSSGSLSCTITSCTCKTGYSGPSCGNFQNCANELCSNGGYIHTYGEGSDVQCSEPPQCTCLNRWENDPTNTSPTQQQCTFCSIKPRCHVGGSQPELVDANCSKCLCLPGFTGEFCQCQLSYLTLSLWNPPEVFAIGFNSSQTFDMETTDLQNAYFQTLKTYLRNYWETQTSWYGDVTVEKWFTALSSPQDAQSYPVLTVTAGFVLACYSEEPSPFIHHPTSSNHEDSSHLSSTSTSTSTSTSISFPTTSPKRIKHFPSQISFPELQSAFSKWTISDPHSDESHSIYDNNVNNFNLTFQTQTHPLPFFASLQASLQPNEPIPDPLFQSSLNTMRKVITEFLNPSSDAYNVIPQSSQRPRVHYLITPASTYEILAYDPNCKNSVSLQCPSNILNPFAEDNTILNPSIKPPLKPKPADSGVNVALILGLSILCTIATVVAIVIIFFLFCREGLEPPSSRYECEDAEDGRGTIEMTSVAGKGRVGSRRFRSQRNGMPSLRVPETNGEGDQIVENEDTPPRLDGLGEADEFDDDHDDVQDDDNEDDQNDFIDDDHQSREKPCFHDQLDPNTTATDYSDTELHFDPDLSQLKGNPHPLLQVKSISQPFQPQSPLILTDKEGQPLRYLPSPLDVTMTIPHLSTPTIPTTPLNGTPELETSQLTANVEPHLRHHAHHLHQHPHLHPNEINPNADEVSNFTPTPIYTDSLDPMLTIPPYMRQTKLQHGVSFPRQSTNQLHKGPIVLSLDNPPSCHSFSSHAPTDFTTDLQYNTVTIPQHNNDSDYQLSTLYSTTSFADGQINTPTPTQSSLLFIEGQSPHLTQKPTSSIPVVDSKSTIPQ